MIPVSRANKSEAGLLVLEPRCDWARERRRSRDWTDQSMFRYLRRPTICTGTISHTCATDSFLSSFTFPLARLGSRRGERLESWSLKAGSGRQTEKGRDRNFSFRARPHEEKEAQKFSSFSQDEGIEKMGEKRGGFCRRTRV
ncbi:hypothetical protein ACLOJK_014515 [Asimina triloba]